MNKRFVGYTLGRLLLVISAVFLVPLALGIFEFRGVGLLGMLRHPMLIGFALAAATSALAGLIFARMCRQPDEMAQGPKEGFAVVTFGWLLIALVGCLPFFAHFLWEGSARTPFAVLQCFTNAYFETMSGFTTTGATILPDVEELPKSLLFWRSLTHWLGGMGIITLVLVVFPALGISGYQMFRGEVPGPTTEKLQPRLTETAKMLWGVYALLSLAETLLLLLGGMSLFDAICHTFGTMATGGFSTKNASIGHYNSHYFDWVIVVFMFLAGVNFMIHYRVVLQGRTGVLKRNSEFRFYALTVFLAVLFCTLVVYVSGILPQEMYVGHFRNSQLDPAGMSAHLGQEQAKASSFYGCLRYSAFQVVSLVTTTGYCTADFDAWPDACRFLLVVLMFFGGCVGSTGGGIKMGRIMILAKAGTREIYKMLKPKLIAPLRIKKGGPIDEHVVMNILGFAILFLGVFLACSLAMTLFIPDAATAMSTVISSLCNIGPGLSGIGATQTYAWIPVPGKWILIFCMLLGRLEVFTVLAILLPSTWRR